MFEDDYLLRLIKEMVRTVLKLVFNLELKDDDPVSVVFESENAEKRAGNAVRNAADLRSDRKRQDDDPLRNSSVF